MQREIKFRAWDAEKNRMIYPQPLGEIAFGKWRREPHQGWIFLQFTGLKDSTGREIFEGDVVRVKRKVRSTESIHPDYYYEKETIATVVFKNGCFVVGEEGWYFWDYVQGGTDAAVEIIGNAFEHSELPLPPSPEKINNN